MVTDSKVKARTWQGTPPTHCDICKKPIEERFYDCKTAAEFGQAVAIAKGTPSKPLCEPEDLYEAKIVELSEPAAKLGIQLGMTGMQALEKLLQ